MQLHISEVSNQAPRAFTQTKLKVKIQNVGRGAAPNLLT